MTELIHIDGSLDEGGGQIVRSSLALSLVTGQPVVIENIRAGRQKPGLMRQHLTAVQAAARIGCAEVTGAAIGSRTLTFAPQTITPGEYHFSIGTAGSTTLVLQTILPALLIASGPSRVILEGGTHNQWAPPFDFLQRAFLPCINRMGPRVGVELERHGFFPAGGGRFTVTIEPAAQLQGFHLTERGELKSRAAIALLSNLPRHIGERETHKILSRMNWDRACGRVDEVSAHGPGNVVFAAIEYEHVAEVFTGFGRVGAASEKVASEVVDEIRNYLKANVPVGQHLADQLLLPLGISAWQAGEHQRGGSFRTLTLTRHSTTQIELLRRWLGIQIQMSADEDGTGTTVTLEPPAQSDRNSEGRLNRLLNPTVIQKDENAGRCDRSEFLKLANSQRSDQRGFIDGRLHSFRHYFCSTCANAGVKERVLMNWLGHRNSKMVHRYYHLHDDESRRQMKQVSLY
ncbi:RNA 3'-terminal phosphate cyclase [Planctomicrobium piriforme]|uniref:RNA 3'-terminal phosphate cyclase n=1 Tax=Planctomicrobium piriforme TaxID=1576369 RepID=A0A1I3Q2X4_9PLAN|nr:RNA 3'-terminal phosphate cyclase [Planctomicrobium piriforme]SFJ27791.1 RNA 3'-terminal phosphate cyclase (ATP) [Planctomicrobium piriforme]